MDWGYKAMLTAVTVAAVLMVAQLFGRRLAGMLAGLPVITAPALLWLAHERGAAFAAASAVGSVAACGAAALFALAYARLAGRCGPVASLVGSLSIGGGVAMLLSLLAGNAWAALGVTALACTLVLRLLPRSPVPTANAARPRAQIWPVAIIAGAMCALIGLVAAQVGPYWSGLLASLPIISACALIHQHVSAQPDDVHRFLRGYVTGLGAKTLFAAAFAWLVLWLPAAVAMLLALVLALVAALLASSPAKRPLWAVAGRAPAP
jgi:hypothetical protein